MVKCKTPLCFLISIIFTTEHTESAEMELRALGKAPNLLGARGLPSSLRSRCARWLILAYQMDFGKLFFDLFDEDFIGGGDAETLRMGKEDFFMGQGAKKFSGFFWIGHHIVK